MAKPLFPIALSITDAAHATRLPSRVIRRAVYDASLEAHMCGDRVRIPVVCLVDWIRSLPRATLAKATKGRVPT
jgi:hypothetical protein